MSQQEFGYGIPFRINPDLTIKNKTEEDFANGDVVNLINQGHHFGEIHISKTVEFFEDLGRTNFPGGLEIQRVNFSHMETWPLQIALDMYGLTRSEAERMRISLTYQGVEYAAILQDVDEVAGDNVERGTAMWFVWREPSNNQDLSYSMFEERPAMFDEIDFLIQKPV